MLAHQRSQRAPRPHLEQEAVGIAHQLPHPLAEADGAAQLLHPVGRIGGLGGADPGAGQARQVRDARRVERHPPQLGVERLEDRLKLRRVEGARDRQAGRGDLALAQHRLDLGDRLRRPGEDHRAGSVHRGERQPRPERRQVGLGGGDRQHGPRRQALDEPSARRHQGQGVVQLHDAGQAGGDQLAEAVADHRRRLDAPRHPQPGEAVFDGEQRRLRDRHRGKRRERRRRRCPRCRLPRRRVGEQRSAQVEIQQRLEPRGAAIEERAELRLGAIDAARHDRLLCTLAGEHEDHRRLPRLAGERRAALGERQGRRRRIRGDDQPLVAQQGAAPLQRVGDVGERGLRMAAEEGREVSRRTLEGAGGPGRHHQRLVRPRRTAGRRGGRFLDDHVRVGAADAERAHAGAARLPGSRPGA